MDVLFSYIFGWVYFTTRVCMNKDTIIEKKEGTDSRGIFVIKTGGLLGGGINRAFVMKT